MMMMMDETDDDDDDDYDEDEDEDDVDDDDDDNVDFDAVAAAPHDAAIHINPSRAGDGRTGGGKIGPLLIHSQNPGSNQQFCLTKNTSTGTN